MSQPDIDSKASSRLGSKSLIFPLVHISALSLVVLWGLGYFVGLGVIFHWVFLVHCFTLVGAAVLAVFYILNCFRHTAWPTIFLTFVLLLSIFGSYYELLIGLSDSSSLSGDLFLANFWRMREKFEYADLAWHVPSHYPSLLRAALTEAVSLFPFWILPVYQLLFFITAAALSAYLVYQESELPETSSLAALFLLSLPVGLVSSSLSFGVGPLVLFFVVGLCHSLRWTRKLGGFVTATACGLALGLLAHSHYLGTVLFPFILVFIFFCGIVHARSFSGSVIAVVWITLIAALVVLPVVTSNLVFTGNPIYPLARSVMGGDYYAKIIFDPLVQNSFGSNVSSIFAIKSIADSWGQHLSAPFMARLFLLILGALSAFFWSLRYRWLPLIIGLSVIYVLVLAYELGPSLEHFSILAPLLAIAAALGFVNSFKFFFSKYWSEILLLVLCLHFLVYVLWLRQDIKKTPNGIIASNLINQDELPRAVGSLGEMIEFVNQSTRITKLYLVCMPDTFLLYKRSIIAEESKSAKRFISLIKHAGSEHELFFNFRKAGISHLAVQTGCMQQAIEIGLTGKAKERFANFVKKYLNIVYSNSSFDLFKLEKLKDN